jgi:hypothetical protein
MKKVLVMRANNLRHLALSAFLSKHGYLSAEIIESKMAPLSSSFPSNLLDAHLTAREQSEIDFFSFASDTEICVPRLEILSGELNSAQTFQFLDLVDFDLVITFGVSILSPQLINHVGRKILGIHLGLSPYYRGSGTNFFPFVNSEVAAVGYTLMHLDEGIDTGPIIHQGRAPVILGDSIHSIGNRNIQYMFSDIARFLEFKIDWEFSNQKSHLPSKLYKRKDFTLESLKLAYKNIDSGLIARHIENQNSDLELFPIIEYTRIKYSR